MALVVVSQKFQPKIKLNYDSKNEFISSTGSDVGTSPVVSLLLRIGYAVCEPNGR